MARYLASYLRWAPKTAAGVEGTNFPTYGDAMDMGPLASVAETINTTRAENHADNELEEFVEEFVSLGIAATVTEMPIDTVAKVYGATKSANGGVAFNKNDAPPEGGLGLVSGGQFKDESGVRKAYYQGVFYPSVKGVRQGTTFNTKGSSISFTNASTNFTGTTEENGFHTVWSAKMSTEAAAKAWVDKMLKGGAEALAEAQAAAD